MWSFSPLVISLPPLLLDKVSECVNTLCTRSSGFLGCLAICEGIGGLKLFPFIQSTHLSLPPLHTSSVMPLVRFFPDQVLHSHCDARVPCSRTQGNLYLHRTLSLLPVSLGSLVQQHPKGSSWKFPPDVNSAFEISDSSKFHCIASSAVTPQLLSCSTALQPAMTVAPELNSKASRWRRINSCHGLFQFYWALCVCVCSPANDESPWKEFIAGWKLESDQFILEHISVPECCGGSQCLAAALNLKDALWQQLQHMAR